MSTLLIFFFALFIIRFVIFSLLEHYYIAHPFDFKKVVIADLTSMAFYTAIIFPLAQYLSTTIGIAGTFLSPLSELPFVLRIVMYLIVGDFLHYWIHRIMHHPYVWRIHRWHHSPNHISWMMGYRASIFDTTFVNLGFIFAWPILGDVSITTRLALLVVFSLLLNDWMHLNIRLRIRFLEKLIIMPRYHHIHHSNNKHYYTKNLSALFPVWDKLFGTYVDPDAVPKTMVFGLDEKIATPRLIIGL
jgi:sterol desaturase/sphingolipid hydroxylase (fatty acid hydroxylase superfamily)